MIFTVMSLQEVRKYVFDETTAVISITEPGQKEVYFLGEPAGVCRLVFHDIDRFDDDRHHKPIGRFEVNQAIAFVKDLPKTVTRIVVHCHAGVSRSPAVAFGCSLALDQKLDAAEFLRCYPCFNRRVLSLFEEVLNESHALQPSQ